MNPGPPGVLLRLLRRALPPGVPGESMVGDLEEEWHRRRSGPRRTVWFVGAALSLSLRYAAADAADGAVRATEVTGTALRRAFRDPLVTGLTVLALGVGIAAPATMFSIVRGLTAEVDVEEPDRLVHVGRRFSPRVVGIAPVEWLWPGLSGVEGLETVGLYARDRMDLSGDGDHAARLDVVRVTPEVLRAFGGRTAVGRSLVPGDASDPAAPVVLGWALWQNRFGGDPSAVGRTVRLDGEPRTVVGVMERGFDLPGAVEAWVPLDPRRPPPAASGSYQVVARLADGVGVDAVQARADALTEALRARGEQIPPGRGLSVQLWRHHLVSARDRRMLGVMVLVVGFVLVIACADVLNLLLARALGRSRETAVRVALGAGRGRVVGEHLAEATVLSVLAGLVGLGLTLAAVRAFEVSTAGQLAHWMEVGVDLRVLLAGAGLVAATALATGLVPAAQSSRVDPGAALRDGGRGASAFRIGTLRKALVAGQIALSCALLVVAGIMIRGAVDRLATEGEYATESVLTARFELRPDPYDEAAARAFQRRVVESLRAHPAVAEAALMSTLPGGLFPRRRPVEVEGTDDDGDGRRRSVTVVEASPSFLATLDVSTLRGRGFGPGDAEVSAPGPVSVLVNEAFVREHLPDREPLGARIRLGTRPDSMPDTRPPLTVIGVVPPLGLDVDGDGPVGAGVYLPASLGPLRNAALVVRAAPGTDPLSLVPEVRDRVAGLDPDLALWDVRTMADQIRGRRAVEAVFAALFLGFGLAGLLLAGIGLYGLLAFTVRRRVRELGVRSALGAGPWRVLRVAMGGGALQLAAGLAAGLGLAALLAPLFGPALLGADPRDPGVYLGVAGVLGLVGLAASAVPAARALRVDVVEALRTE